MSLKIRVLISVISISCWQQSTRAVTAAEPKANASPERKPSDAFGQTVFGQSLTISAAKTTYLRGARIALTIRHKNVGDREVTDVRDRYRGPLWRYTPNITYADGTVVPYTLFGKADWKRDTDSDHARESSWSEQVLKPSESSSDELDLTDYYDLTLPGKYVIWASKDVARPNGGWSKATSNKLEITINSDSGCEKNDKPAQANNAAVGTTVAGQSLSVSVHKATCERGDRVFLTVRFKNVSDHDVTEAHDRYQELIWRYSVSVRDQDGQDASYTAFGKKSCERKKAPIHNGSGVSETLKPGDAITNVIALSDYYDFTLSGKYSILAKTKVIMPDGSRSKVDAVSNKLEISVNDPKGPDDAIK